MKTVEVYDIIRDRTLLEEFVYDFLPELKPNEWFYGALFARKKYTDQPIQYPNKGDRSQVARFVTKKDRLIQKIERLEVKVGTYVARNGVAIPEESLALYIHPNPRDSYKATFKAIKEFAEVGINGDRYYDPVSNLRSVVHRTKSKDAPFIIFDIDSRDTSYLDSAREILTGRLRVLTTRGGYHIIVLKSDIEAISKQKKLWYKEMMNLSDQHGDIMIPVPGTVQGNFVPFLD